MLWRPAAASLRPSINSSHGVEMGVHRFTHYNYEIGPATAPVLAMRVGVEEALFIPDWVEGGVRHDPATHGNIHRGNRCPAFGPIRVEGARPGMGLCVEILHVRVADVGIMVLRPGVGLLGGKVGKDEVLFLPIRDGHIEFPRGRRLPVAPMVGVIGVTPATWTVRTLMTGDYGGNLDTREIAAGARVHLPVQAPGAGLYLADVHAAMGDGEISGSGVEVAGEVGIRVSLAERAPVDGPLVETEAEWITLATDPDPETALRTAADRMVTFLASRLRTRFEEAYLLAGAAGHAAISQVVNQSGVTCKVKFPKRLITQTSVL